MRCVQEYKRDFKKSENKYHMYGKPKNQLLFFKTFFTFTYSLSWFNRWKKFESLRSR